MFRVGCKIPNSTPRTSQTCAGARFAVSVFAMGWTSARGRRQSHAGGARAETVKLTRVERVRETIGPRRRGKRVEPSGGCCQRGRAGWRRKQKKMWRGEPEPELRPQGQALITRFIPRHIFERYSAIESMGGRRSSARWAAVRRRAPETPPRQAPYQTLTGSSTLVDLICSPMVTNADWGTVRAPAGPALTLWSSSDAAC